MPRIKETMLYKYDELNDDAKARARDWWRDLEARSGDTFFAESVTDDFKDVLKAAGFSLDSRRNVARGRSADVLYWSGFSSQGDGACFAASWYAPRVNVAALIADRPVTYTDRETGKEQRCEHNARLVPILEHAARLAQSYPDGCGTIAANDRYMSTRCEFATVSDDSHSAADDQLQEELDTLARDLANHFYRTLEAEYGYLMSDEQVAETIIANEYEFTENGSFAS